MRRASQPSIGYENMGEGADRPTGRPAMVPVVVVEEGGTRTDAALLARRVAPEGVLAPESRRDGTLLKGVNDGVGRAEDLLKDDPEACCREERGSGANVSAGSSGRCEAPGGRRRKRRTSDDSRLRQAKGKGQGQRAEHAR
jgi:hypothetical protein